MGTGMSVGLQALTQPPLKRYEFAFLLILVGAPLVYAAAKLAPFSLARRRLGYAGPDYREPQHESHPT